MPQLQRNRPMLLSDYEWSRNPRGMHVRSPFDSDLSIRDYRTWGMGWVKLVVASYDYLGLVPRFIDAGITPVVRVYLGRHGNQPMTRQHRDYYIRFAQAGVKWFEFYNEPNLPVEWPIGVVPDWRNRSLLEPLVENWLDWAEFIVSIGGYPGFVPFAESADVTETAVLRWIDAMLAYIANRHYDRFINLAVNGLYCATHPYILNHFYQEGFGGNPRPPGEQRARGTSPWHFEYPYDPFTQSLDPGRTAFGGTDQTPFGDPNGLIAVGRIFNERCAELFGVQSIPVLGTEGGIWRFPAPGEAGYQQDVRFPPYTNQSHAQATLAMFDWIAQQAPPWFFGVTLWIEDDYVEDGQAALNVLSQNAPYTKEVPDISVLEDSSFYFASGAPDSIRGPGPVHGQADLHMVLLDDTLSVDWFFETASGYWDRFRPIVTTNTDFLDMMPYSKSLAITLVVSSVRRFEAENFIRENYPNAYLDPLIVQDGNTYAQLATVFQQRVETGRRFG